MEEKKSTPAKIGHVYFITSGDGYCKIGRSTNPASRLSALQSGTAQRLHLHHKIMTDNEAKCETFLHKALRHYRTRGEWFDLPGYILTLIRGIETLNMADMNKDQEETIYSWLPPDKNPRLVEERIKNAREQAQKMRFLADQAAKEAEKLALQADVDEVNRFASELLRAVENLEHALEELKEYREEERKQQERANKERERLEKSLSLYAKLDDWRRKSHTSLVPHDQLRAYINEYIDSLAVQNMRYPYDRLLRREDAAKLLDCPLHSVSRQVAPFSRRPARYRLSDLVCHVAVA